MDLKKLSSKELRDLRKDVDRELQSRRRDEQKRAKQELREVADKYGFSLDETSSWGRPLCTGVLEQRSR